ncbi:MAG: hypothetical protein V3T83_20125 [Acidobacteriota bacterium]
MKKDPDQSAEALVNAIERLLGDPMQADEEEVNQLFAEFGQGIDPRRRVYEISARSARKHRLEKGAVPVHVKAALEASKEVDLDQANPSQLQQIIDSVKKPLLGPAQSVSYAYRNRQGELSDRDNEALEDLADEVKMDWREE